MAVEDYGRAAFAVHRGLIERVSPPARTPLDGDPPNRKGEAMLTKPKTALAAGLALTIALAGCGSDDASDPASADTGEDPPAPGTVQVAESDLGTILVDAEGMTLYLFQADADGTSTCYDDCATTWPPLIDDAPAAGEGADPALIGTTPRDDGSVQVTYDGQPLYFFAADQGPGDTEGQGVGDVWFVVDPAGAAITEQARTGPGY
jgi:predicted lipoprotein with Yx(FWY)xxD motif